MNSTRRTATAAKHSILLGLIAVLPGCVPFAEPLADDPLAGNVDMASVVAPAGFDFATSQPVRATVQLRSPNGQPAGLVPVTLYDAEPSEGGNALAYGVTRPDGSFAADVQVPTDLNRLVAIAGHPSLTRPIALSIVNRTASGAVAVVAPAFLISEEQVDGDRDGVADPTDAAPADPTIAFESYAPARYVMNTIAFEDSWPAKGDYDYNDLIVDYNVRYLLNTNNMAQAIVVSFELRAAGAGQRNAFAFSLPIAASEVASVTGRRINSGLFPSLPTGVEARQRRAVIIVTDDVNKQLPRPSGYLVNTQNAAPEVPPEMITIVVTFRNPVAPSALGSAPFDPFLIVNRIRGREIHLADHAPTDLADVGLFSTGDDDSRPATGRYYRTRNNLPSALVVPTNWDYPAETAQVTRGFLHFHEWAMSGGTAFTDWYSPTLGYRAPSQLYARR
ncbi:MAG: LruC domain-containing protein [Gemmatimonadaceae bacterium]